MHRVMRVRALVAVSACLVLGVAASPAVAAQKFRPRVGNALGLVPPVNSQGHFNTVPPEFGVFNAVTYHGGPTMTAGGAVHVHVIFWQAPGFAFQGSPGAGVPTYEGTIEQFFTDVAHDSATGPSPAPGTCTTSECNDFTVEPQYGDGTTVGGVTSGANAVTFTNPGSPDAYPGTLTGADVIVDANPYPDTCSSPQDTRACIFDSDLQAEIDNIIQAEPTQERGLQNLWYVFLPPDVDECISQDVCGTNAFGGYHSLSNVNGHGLTIYALTIDPLIEAGAIAQGADPQGNPDAEVAADIADHETNEAMTDPTGVGWIDPNAFEVGDKCEFGPQRGTPLGFAADGSPYNQVINGDQYLLQEMWSQADGGCAQASTKTISDSGLPLPLVNLTQFSGDVSGNIGSHTAGIPVEVEVLRNTPLGSPETVADRTTTTDSNGNWSLTGGNALQHPAGDDRDAIEVIYNGGSAGAGVPAQPQQLILTGNGGNPFIEGGWMGWSDMDNGANVDTNTLTLAPCFQTGVLASSVTTETPTDFCGTASDAAAAPTNTAVGSGTAVTWSSLDNRAFQPPDSPFAENDAGGLVNLTVPAGEPGSVSAQGSFLDPNAFDPTGFPTCTADLSQQAVTCTGLVPGEPYTVNGHGQTADGDGSVTVSMPIHGGDVLALSNGSRTLTTLHVAHLRVDLEGDSPTVAGGSCQSQEYWGGPLTGPVFSDLAGELGGGPAATGVVCGGGNPSGLSSSTLAQTDDRSGGQTVTEVADIANTSPLYGETVYGSFTALAQTTDGSSPVSLTVTKAGGSPQRISSNADTANGVAVSGLAPGNYTASWVVTNANGDTRTVTTRFIEQSALQGAQGPQGPQGTQGPPGPRGPQGSAGPKPKVMCKLVRHNKIQCKVTYPKGHKKHGIVRLAVTRGGKLVALGHATLSRGRATLTMRELRSRSRGPWQVVVVFSRTVKSSTSTVTVTVRK